jgi:phenylacetate-coenzyme A ligase PaaK-like adenylate-forming protein
LPRNDHVNGAFPPFARPAGRAKSEEAGLTRLPPLPAGDGGGNLFPTQVEELLLRTAELSPHFQCVLRREGRLGAMTVRVERRPGVDAAAGERAGDTLPDLVKQALGVSVDVDVVGPQTGERSVGKKRRIVDERNRT